MQRGAHGVTWQPAKQTHVDRDIQTDTGTICQTHTDIDRHTYTGNVYERSWGGGSWGDVTTCQTSRSPGIDWTQTRINKAAKQNMDEKWGHIQSLTKSLNLNSHLSLKIEEVGKERRRRRRSERVSQYLENHLCLRHTLDDNLRVATTIRAERKCKNVSEFKQHEP